MTISLINSPAFQNPSAPLNAVDLTGVSSVCPASERARWKVLVDLLDSAILAQADEIHLEPDNDCLRLRLRTVFGLSEVRIENAASHIDCMELLQSYLWGDSRQTKARRAWFGFTLQTGPRLIQLDAVPTSRGDTYLITLQHDLKAPPPRLDELPLSRKQQSQVRELLKQESGLLLVACSHPQARAQTVRAMAQELVAPDRKIICAEAPGHPPMPRVIQLAIDTVAAPDNLQNWPALCELGCDAIVACNTHSDDMTQLLARQASSSTLIVQGVRADSAAAAVDHLLAAGVRSEAIARSLSAVLVQRRLQCLCPYCRYPHSPDDQGTAWLSEHSPIIAGNINVWLQHRLRSSFSTADGCERCNHTGLGKTLDLCSIVTLDDEIRDSFYNNDIRRSLQRLRDERGMSRDLLRLAQEGIITLAEAARILPVTQG